MEPAISPLLLKAAGLASEPIMRTASRTTVRARVAWVVAKQSRKQGIQVTSAALRRWLARPDVREQLRLGSAATVISALAHLAWLLPGDEGRRCRDAETVLFLVLAAFLRAQDAAAATALAHEWQTEHTRAEGRATREEVRTTGQSILDRLSTSQVFTEHVRTLHPWRRDDVLTIRDSWPTIEQVVQAFTAAEDRGRLLRQWAELPPSWYADAPAEVVCWLGDLAADYGQRAAAADFLSVGLDRGVFPAGYWQAKRALYLYLLQEDVGKAVQILEAVQDEHPLPRCLLAWHRESWQEAMDALSTWSSTSDADHALKLQFQARLTVAVGDLNGGIALALQAAEIEEASGAAVLAAELLLSRARFGQSVHRLADAAQALQLALRARNARRSWQGDSVAAVLVAVKAAALGGNHPRAWALTQELPEGEATEAEATDPRLRREAARLAAMTGRYELARTLAQQAGESFTEAEIVAIEVTEQGEPVDAIAAWETAFGLAVDDADILIAAMNLAELGAAVPELGNLEHTHPEIVREIRVVQEAMAADGNSLEALRSGAHQSLILTLKLAELHADGGDWRMAGDVLKEGAERWTQPQLMLMAARHYRRAGDLSAARATAESALTVGGPSWAGEFEARAFLLKVHDANGDWERATQEARVLVTLDPHDSDARWALVHCLVRRGDLEAAWNAMSSEDGPVPPRDRHDALTWIGLASRYDTSPQFVPRALATMRRWPDDEQLTGVFIGALSAGVRREELAASGEDIAALHAATAEYTERFPDSTVFRTVSIPQDDPLAPLAPQLREQHDAVQDIARLVRDGLLPLGMLAEAAHRSYAEACLQRATGFVSCHNPVMDAQGEEAVRAALDHPVVIDTTAAHTLTLLDPQTRSRLTAVFGQVLTTDPAYRDALRGHESLGLRSTMSAGWDPVAGRPRVTTIDESVADQLADRAQQLSEILGAAVRRPWPELKTIEGLDDYPSWLTSLDMAATQGIPYWCDDAVLRSLAASYGAATFDTVDLLRHLAAERRLQHDLLTVTEATLISNYYVDLGFDRRAWDLAATMDGWRPRGAAFAAARPAAWTAPAAILDFVFSALQQRAEADLEDLEGWVTAAAFGLVRIASDADSASINLRVLLGRCLTQPWMRPDRLPVVLRAARAAHEERPDMTDQLKPVLAETYRTLVAQHGYAVAAHLLMSLVQFASEPDRFTAASVVLTYQV